MTRAADPLRHAALLDADEKRPLTPERERLLARALSLMDDLYGRAKGAKGARLCELGAALVLLGKVNEGRKCHDRGVALLRDLGDTPALELVEAGWKAACAAATPDMCPRCRLDPGLCLCGDVVRVETKSRFVILRHMNESRRRTNSGRIAALALSNGELVDRRERGDELDFEPPPGAWLLFPGGHTPASPAPPAAVVVLDGTWREAKRMFIRVPALQRLPRLSLGPPAPTLRLRKPPSYGMATLESIAHAVEALEGPEKARPLHELFALFVARNLEGARRAGRRLLR